MIHTGLDVPSSSCSACLFWTGDLQGQVEKLELSELREILVCKYVLLIDNLEVLSF
jgi:hypothetical protein